MSATLYICATPIGNLEDITLRVLRVLREVDWIAAEDTRQTRKLLTHFGISARLVSYHEHNWRNAGERIIQYLRDGESVALVSDAGMPAISDPGNELVRRAVSEGIEIQVLPGPSAGVTALVLSALPTDRFAFEGFIPRKGSERTARLKEIQSEKRSMVIYEAPHRLLQTLRDLAGAVGEDRQASLSRELTKIHEETVRGTLGSILSYVAGREPRGEYVIVVGGAQDTPAGGRPAQPRSCPGQEMIPIEERLRGLLREGMSKRDAAKTVAREYGRSAREVYRLAVELASDASR